MANLFSRGMKKFESNDRRSKSLLDVVKYDHRVRSGKVNGVHTMNKVNVA